MSEKNTDRKEEKQRKIRANSVIQYLTVMFMAALLLLLLTLAMDWRRNQTALEGMGDELDGITSTLSTMQSIEELYNTINQLTEENATLSSEIEDLVEENAEKDAEIAGLSEATDELLKVSDAMDWFWQIDEAFVLGKYTLARELIGEMTALGLVPYLPEHSVTDNLRFSPADRLQEIIDKIN